MFLRIVVLSGMIFSSNSVAQTLDEEDHHPWHLQLAIAPRGKSLNSIHVLTEITTHSQIGISYSKGEDSLDIFQEATASRSLYSSDRLPYQMFALRFQYFLYKNFWLGLSVGRLEVHETKNLVDQNCYYCDGIVYLGSTNGPAMDVDISKSYGSFSLGWQAEVLPQFSVGLALDYVFKGDASGVRVNSLNGSLMAERDQLHSAMIDYARKDYLQPLQLMLGYNF